MTTALLLIAHGSRNADANADLHQLAEAMRKRAEYPIVEAAFLELAEPNIPQGGRRCVERGAQRVVLVPYFLSAGVHVREDLQRFRADLATQFPDVQFILSEPLGPHAALMEVILQRAQEALSPR
jgi:sirohydrochlorin ferrochelatase